MAEVITPVNITAAAVMTQVCLIVIMFVGAVLLRSGDVVPFYREAAGTTRLAWVILPFALLTLGPLVFSSDFSATWRPLLGGAQVPVMSSEDAIFLMFVSDIVCVALLVRLTGGGRSSPFVPVYFVLPALAIFLREPSARVFGYTFVIVALFVSQLSWVPRRSHDSYARAEVMAYGVVSALCLLVTTAIGYVTRPR